MRSMLVALLAACQASTPPAPDAGSDPSPEACGPSDATSRPLVAGGRAAFPAGGGLGPELAQNASFDTDIASWQAPPQFARDTTVAHSGGASIRLKGANTGTTPIAVQTVMLHPGVYKLSGWIKTSALGATAPNTGVRLDVDFRPAVNDWQPTQVISGTTDWTYV